MRHLFLAACALVLAMYAKAQESNAQMLPPQRWSAGNSSGECTLSGLVRSGRDVGVLTFSFISPYAGSTRLLTLSASASLRLRPVRIELANDPAARFFDLRPSPAMALLTTYSLRGQSAEIVLTYLLSGGDLYVFYGSEAVQLGQNGFRQSHARFIACLREMSPNNALEQTRGP